MKKLVIIGAGGLGREVAWLVERINTLKSTWNLLGYVDDNNNLYNKMINGYPILGNCDWLNNQKDDIYAVCAIASTYARKNLIQKFKNIKFATLIDPSVIMSERVIIEEGTIICAGTIITVDIKIGSHVIINPDCKIGHDAILYDFVTLYHSVNISGNTMIRECVEMGTGSIIIQGLNIGEGTIVGAGAVVIKELPKECTAVGNPAKVIKYH